MFAGFRSGDPQCLFAFCFKFYCILPYSPSRLPRSIQLTIRFPYDAIASKLLCILIFANILHRSHLFALQFGRTCASQPSTACGVRSIFDLIRLARKHGTLYDVIQFLSP